MIIVIGIHGGKSFEVKKFIWIFEFGIYFTFRTTEGSNELSVFQNYLKPTKKTVSLAMAETEQQSGKAQLKASAQH